MGTMEYHSQVEHIPLQVGPPPVAGQHPRPSRQAASIDDILAHEVGQFGWAQQVVLLVAGVAFIASATTMFLPTFTSPTDPSLSPDNWHCVQAPLEDPTCHAVWSRGHIPASSMEEQPVSHRDTAAGSTAHQELTFCDLNRDQYVWVHPETSLAKEFNLVCGHSWKVDMIQTLFFVGYMLGNGLLGRAADAYGRRRIMLAAAAVLVVLSLLSAAAPTCWLHTVIRAVSGAAAAGTCLSGYVLVSELVGPAWRGAAGMLVQTFYIVGECFLVGLVMLTQHSGWRALTASSIIPPALLLTVVWMVPESPRWLLTMGRVEEAEHSLHWIARLNRTRLVSRPSSSPQTYSLSEPQLELQPQAASKHEALPQCDSMHSTGSAQSLIAVPVPDRGPAVAHSSLHKAPQQAEDDAESSDDVQAHADNNGQVSRSYLGVGSTEDCSARGHAIGKHQALHHRHTELEDGSRAWRDQGVGGCREGRDEEELEAGEHVPLMAQHDPQGARLPGHAHESPAEQSLYHLLQHRTLAFLFLVTTYTMCTLSMAYFGVTLALGTLAGDLRLNFLLTSLAELPAYLGIAASVEQLGRRPVVLLGAALAGAACLIVPFAPPGGLQVLLAIVGKFGCSGAWALGMTYTSELFPTSCRSAAVGAISQAGDVGGILAPLLMLLGQHLSWMQLPFFIMGVLSCAGALLVTLLPETRGLPQSDTIQDLLKTLAAHSKDTRSFF